VSARAHDQRETTADAAPARVPSAQFSGEPARDAGSYRLAGEESEVFSSSSTSCHHAVRKVSKGGELFVQGKAVKRSN